MTLKEFEDASFYKGMVAIYKETECKIVSVDFEEMLVGILVKDNEHGTDFDVTWVRAENCMLKSFPY